MSQADRLSSILDELSSGGGVRGAELSDRFGVSVATIRRDLELLEEQRLVSSVLRAFPEEFAAHIEQRSCPQERPRPMPKLVDLADGRATYDETFWRKRPDWTYEPE